jgi:preprotein translocase subunit SecE
MARSRTRKPAGKSKDLDPSRWTHAIFVLAGFLTAWVMVHFVDDMWAFVGSYMPEIGRPQSWMSTGIGLVVALGLTIWGWRKEKYFQFVNEVVVEVSQVTWPTRAETRAATVVVIVISLICSCLLWVMDVFWNSVTDYLYAL